MQVALIAMLLTSALLAWLAGRAARRFGLPEPAGPGLALGAIATVIALSPGGWREWLIGGNAGERSLVFATEIGLTGLLFLAGTRFDLKEVWQARRISFLAAAAGMALFVAAALLLLVFGDQDRYAVVATAAAIASSSLWLPGEAALTAGKKEPTLVAASKGAAAVLTLVLMLVVHLYSVFHDITGRTLSGSAYAIVVSYELMKLVVFFSLAYFAVSRFLARAEGRISGARILIGYLLMAVLVFVLAASLIGPLGALAWSFVAGSIFTRNETVKQFGKKPAPAASAMFLTIAFLPVVLQSHGRALTGTAVVAAAVAGALIGKLAMGWVAAKAAGASAGDAKVIAASTIASGEAAIVFLGFAMSRWVIESAEYFIVLSFALVSMIAGSVFWRHVSRDKEDYETGTQALSPKADKDNRPRRSRGKRKGDPTKKAALAVFAVAVALTAFGPTAFAQSQPTTDEDPVTRAMKSVEAVVDERAKAADVVMAASKLVNESAAARKQGDRGRAREALSEAKKIAAETDEFNRSALIEELARIVAAEQAALSPAKAQAQGQFSAGKSLSIAVPRSALARMDSYRDSFVQILEEERVPVGLLGVALVESGFNPLALSPKGARGIWQFMPATAARYGLAVGPGGDHRTHPEHSTRAAARYLRDLYQMFGDWKLAIAAYNAGEGRVQRIIKRTGIRDFDEMSRRGLLPAETRKYVPAVLAAWSRVGGPGATTQASASQTERNNKRSNGQTVQALTRPGESGPTSEGAKR